jgi:hexokinase
MHNDPKIRLFPELDERSSKLYTRWNLDTSILSVAAADDSENLQVLRNKIAEDFDVPLTTVREIDAKVVKTISHAIGLRAARLAGSAVAAVILKSERLKSVSANGGPADIGESGIVDVGVDGSVVELYPRFEEYMRGALRAVEGVGKRGEERIRNGLSKDGSSIGTAIVGLLAAKQRDEIDKLKKKWCIIK